MAESPEDGEDLRRLQGVLPSEDSGGPDPEVEEGPGASAMLPPQEPAGRAQEGTGTRRTTGGGIARPGAAGARPRRGDGEGREVHLRTRSAP